MNIRPYVPEDFEGIHKVIDSINPTGCWPLYFPDGWDAERVRKEFAPISGYRDPLFLVVEEDTEIIGLTVGHDLDSFFENEVPHIPSLGSDHFYQRNVIVHRNHQGRSIGGRLFDRLQTHAREKNYTRLVTRTPLLNSEGMEFFRRRGFQYMFLDDNPERLYLFKNLDGSK